MRRILATVLAVSLLALTGVLVAPALPGSVASAEVSEKELMDQLTKIHKMISDMETKMKVKKMTMDATGKDKMMQMLMDITKMLTELEKQTK